MLLMALINKHAQNVMYQNQALGIHRSRVSQHKKVIL